MSWTVAMVLCGRAGAEADLHGEAEVFHAHAVDGDTTVVGFALRVAQGGRGFVRALHERGT